MHVNEAGCFVMVIYLCATGPSHSDDTNAASSKKEMKGRLRVIKAA